MPRLYAHTTLIVCLQVMNARKALHLLILSSRHYAGAHTTSTDFCLLISIMRTFFMCVRVHGTSLHYSTVYPVVVMYILWSVASA